MGRERALGTRLVGSGAGGEGYIRIMLVLGLERDDVIISLFAGYNVICYLGSSSTFNFVLFLWGELCNRFDWLNVDFTHLTAYQGSETFSLPNWLLKEGLNGVQCLIRGYLPIIFSICW